MRGEYGYDGEGAGGSDIQRIETERHGGHTGRAGVGRGFFSAPLKLVYVLKEVNGGGSWDLRDFLRAGGRPQTWDNVARWTEALFKLDQDRSWSYWEDGCEARRKKYLPCIGVVNLKKTPGSHTADAREIKLAAEQTHSAVAAQIELYQPDIIIYGSTQREFCRWCCPSLAWEQTHRGIWYARIGERVIVSYVHPEARVHDSFLHYPLIEAVREIMTA